MTAQPADPSPSHFITTTAGANALRAYRVGTTYDVAAGIRPLRHWIKAYTRFYGLEWPTLVEYDVQASTPEEARHLARERRFLEECARYVRSDVPH